jgi:hypothetical protein
MENTVWIGVARIVVEEISQLAFVEAITGW